MPLPFTLPKRNNKGAVFAEAACILPVFFLMVLAGLDLLVYFHHNFRLHEAVSSGIRAQTTAARIIGIPEVAILHQIKVDIQRSASSFGFQLNPNDIKICPVSTPNCLNETVGSPRSLISIVVRQPYDSVFGAPFELVSRVMISNEPGLPQI